MTPDEPHFETVQRPTQPSTTLTTSEETIMIQYDYIEKRIGFAYPVTTNDDARRTAFRNRTTTNATLNVSKPNYI